MDLAKELGVTSKDLVVALEGMGHKGMRAMSPLTAVTANELRLKLGRGRELPAEVKPKRAVKAREATVGVEEAPDVAVASTAVETEKEGAPKRVLRPLKVPKVELPAEPAVEAAKPTATIFRPSATPAPTVEVPPVPAPIAPPPPVPVVAAPPPPPAPSVVVPPKPTPAPTPVIPVRLAAVAPPVTPAPPAPRRVVPPVPPPVRPAAAASAPPVVPPRPSV